MLTSVDTVTIRTPQVTTRSASSSGIVTPGLPATATSSAVLAGVGTLGLTATIEAPPPVLTADLPELIATAGIEHPRAFLIPSAPFIVSGSQVRLGSHELPVGADLTLAAAVPAAAYRVQITYYNSVLRRPATWTSPEFTLTADSDLRDLI